MTSLDRLKDLADVQELIKLLHLPSEYTDQLNPFVQGQFQTLWQAVEAARERRLNDVDQ